MSEKHEEALQAAIETAIIAHAGALKVTCPDLCGYAIAPGEPYDDAITHLVAVWSRESEIEADTPYYRYCVDEWKHWDHQSLSAVTPLIEAWKKQFRKQRTTGDRSSRGTSSPMVERFHDIILNAFRNAVSSPVLLPGQFFAIWISDSDHPIINRSVRELNSTLVAQAFQDEFFPGK